MDETDLKLAAVAHVTIMDAQNLTDELRRLKQAMSIQLDSLTQILKAFSDLYLEVTDHTEHRKFLSRQIMEAERKAARLRIPAWFWRVDNPSELRQRASWLLGTFPNLHLDDIWENMREVTHYADLDMSDEQLTNIIKAALDESTQRTA